MENAKRPGYVRGQHYSAYVGEVKRLKREQRFGEAVKLLFELVEATEEEDKHLGYGVAPYYYEELAKIYRKRKDYANEIRILLRYTQQRHAYDDSHQEELKKRLEKAKALLLKNT